MGFGELIHGGPVDADEYARVRDLVMFEGPDVRDRIVKFVVLIVLSSAIATYGLIADSVATVIGAMIVAPLMVPIVGTAFGVSTGDRGLTWRSVAMVALGVVLAVGLGWLLAIPFRVVIDPQTNSQIAARVNPRLIDLFAAIATGLAGAFAISRKDVSDTLPGVAIAISLVPPLANVGILLCVRDYPAAMGSLLLFTTNFLAILLSGAIVFGIMGFPRIALASHPEGHRGVAIATIIVLTLVLLVPLGASGASTVLQQSIQTKLSEATTAWLAGTDYEVASVSVDTTGTVVITGSGSLPVTEALKRELDRRLPKVPVVLEVMGQRRILVRPGAQGN